MLGLCFCVRAFSSCSKRGPLFIAVRGPLTIVDSLVVEHRLQTHRLSNCGSRAQLLRGMWDLPRPGLEPTSPALASRFSTTVPPGKPGMWVLSRRLGRAWCAAQLYWLFPGLLCLKSSQPYLCDIVPMLTSDVLTPGLTPLCLLYMVRKGEEEG